MNKITVISQAEFLSKLHTLTLSSLALFFIAPLPSLANLTPASENEPFLDDSSRNNNATSSLNNNRVNQILPDASGGQAVADLCLFGICAPVNLPSPLENVIEGAINSAVKNQLRSLFTEQIPISGSEHEFYDSVATLPGEAFAPQFLPLSSLPPDTLIPPGDYEIPAHFYCTKIYSFDGRGNRFALARLSGRMSDVLSALYDRASRNPEITTNDVQGLSWAIQTGISYNDLSTSQKALVDQLIPDYRDRMRASLIDQLTETTNRVSRLSGNRLPGVNQILNDLGSVGDVINSLLQARQQILQTSYSSQALAEEFAPQRDVFLQGGVEATPWSVVEENVYLRFIAPDGALNDGIVQVRIIGDKYTEVDNEYTEIDGSYLLAQATIPLPRPRPLHPGIIVAGILIEIIVRSVGVPEASGHQAITATVEESSRLPVYIVYRSRTPEIAAHTLSAFAYNHSRELTYLGPSSPQTEINRRCNCNRNIPRPIDKECDEYPYASTTEGNSCSSHIALIPVEEHRKQRDDLRNFYRLNQLKAGDKFRVEVVE
jgi:hypothetical protein